MKFTARNTATRNRYFRRLAVIGAGIALVYPFAVLGVTIAYKHWFGPPPTIV